METSIYEKTLILIQSGMGTHRETEQRRDGDPLCFKSITAAPGWG